MKYIGIIGCGYWGPNLVRNFHGLPNSRVRTVCDLQPGRLDFIREGYPDIRTTDDMRDILNDPAIDAVVVATPVTSHFEIAVRALEAGKDLFVEKPLAANAREAWELVEMARRLGRVLAVGHVFQFAPGVRSLKSEIDAGRLGRIFHLSSTRINPGPPRTTVDVVWDLCPHDLSIILHLIGEMPLDIRASGSSYKWDGFVDNAHIDMTFPGGVSAHIHVSWLSAHKTRYVQLTAEHGTMVYDEMLALDGKVRIVSNGVDNRIDAKATDSGQLSYSIGDIRVLQLEQHEPLRMECAEFVRAMTDGTPLPNNGEMGARVVELLEWISSEIDYGSRASRRAEAPALVAEPLPAL